MDQCPHCQKPLPEILTSEVCPHCGAALEGAGTVELPGDDLDVTLESTSGTDVDDGSGPDAAATIQIPDEGGASADGIDTTDQTWVADSAAEEEADSVEASAGTVIFESESSEAPVEPAAPTVDLESTSRAPEDEAGDTAGQTVVLPEDSQGSGDRGDATIAIDPSQDDAGGSDKGADQTVMIDEGTAAGGGDDAGATVRLEDVQGAPEGSAADQTVRLEDLGGDAGDTSQTMLSDASMSAEEIKTIQSNWSSLDASVPRMTIKSQGEASAEDSAILGDSVSTVPRRSMETVDPSCPPDTRPEYELVNVLGEGGMGVVWSARQTSVDRHVAVKMIKGDFGAKRSQRQKFLAEAVVTGDLDHPNIVPIYDVGTDGRGMLFYSMKQVQGTPWLKVLKHKTLHENVEILLRVCDAIAFAHSRGIIHRDLKPENVMLGDFGEVLVMDWGLALVVGEFEKARRLRQSTSMGGTPAYMAPEMATGPIDVITPASDIYLLGAILWELITGKPPHPGRKVQECLLAAMRNVIVPTQKTGELVEIAYKAMATNPRDRYATVQDFQNAIRTYLSHSESLAMVARAYQDLARARETEDYQDYARAAFGFEEAVELWDGNEEAKAGHAEAQLAYAESAWRKGDFDLGLSLLSEEIPEHRELQAMLLEAQHERNARQHRLRVAKRLMVTMAVIIFAVVTGAFFWIRAERNFALEQQAIAEEQRDEADRQRRFADEQRKIAQQERDEAERQRIIADEQRVIAQQERDEAQKQRMIADEQRMIAVDRQREAEEQRMIAEQRRQEAIAAKEREEYEAYVARIGLAAAKIDENAFDVALETLEQCPVRLRNWEWGRLMHLCSQASRTYEAKAPVDSVALSPDGTRFLAASWDRTARIWDIATREVLHELPQSGLYVHAAAWSPRGDICVTAGSSRDGFIKLWDAGTGELLSSVDGHTDTVISATFSPDGRWLLTTSYDETARLWSVADPRRPQSAYVFEGHTWWVWDAAFSPYFAPEDPQADNRIVTVSQDGKAIVWNLTGQPVLSAVNTTSIESRLRFQEVAAFTGHNGPIYCVGFAPDGKSVATGGYDKRILLWRPEDVPEFNLRELLERGQPVVAAVELKGHTGAVQDLAFSKDGHLIVSGGRDNAVTVWSVDSARAIKTFRGHYAGVRSVTISSDGREIVSGSQDQRAIVWHLDEYEEIRTLEGRTIAGHEDAILNGSFSPKGDRIVTASRDRTARLWSVETGALLQTLQEGHDYLASRAEFFPDGRTLVTAAADNTVRMWSVESGTQILRLSETGRSAALDVSRDGRWLVTGSDGDSALLWDVPSLVEASQKSVAEEDNGGSIESFRPSRRLVGHNGIVTMARFSPTADLLLTCDTNGRCILRHIETNEIIWNVRYHTRRINDAAFTPDGRQILTASSDHTVSRLDALTGEEIAPLILKHESSVMSLRLSPDGTRALTVAQLDRDEAQASRVTLWDVATARELDAFNLEQFAVTSIDFAPDGRTALAVCSDNVVRYLSLDAAAPDRVLAVFLDFQNLGGLVWTARFTRDGRSVLTVGGSEAQLWDAATQRERIAFSPHGAVAGADFSSDGQRVVTGSWDNSAKIWDAGTGQAVRKLEHGHDGYINSVAYSPDGKYILTASDDGTAKLWSAETSEVLVTYSGHTDRVRTAVFSRDGSRVLTASYDKTARIWDTETGNPVGRPLVGHRWAVLNAVFSPDGTRVFTGSEDNDARLWDAATGDLIAVYQGHTAAISSVAFSNDGQRVFTASQDNTAKLWDASPGREGTEILTLTAHSQEVTTVAVSPDGRNVLTTSRDGTAVIWLTSEWRSVRAVNEEPAALPPE